MTADSPVTAASPATGRSSGTRSRHLQSNKVGRALEIFDVLETVDSVALAEAISNRGSGRNVPVLLEVNISGDPHKHGFTPAGLRAELPRLAGVAGLELLGLMTIPR